MVHKLSLSSLLKIRTPDVLGYQSQLFKNLLFCKQFLVDVTDVLNFMIIFGVSENHMKYDESIYRFILMLLVVRGLHCRANKFSGFVQVKLGYYGGCGLIGLRILTNIIISLFK